MKKYQSFLSENFQCLEMKFSIYLDRRVLVMEVICCAEKQTESHSLVRPIYSKGITLP